MIFEYLVLLLVNVSDDRVLRSRVVHVVHHPIQEEPGWHYYQCNVLERLAYRA